jgi:UrcA family protein
MSKRLIAVAVGLLAGASLTPTVFAQTQDMGEVSVQASRVVKKVIGTTSSGIPIEDISLSYGVSTSGLDLSTAAGAAEMQKRVSNAATSLCKELARQYPNSSTTDAECVRKATDKAMVKVNELVAAAGKKAK